MEMIIFVLLLSVQKYQTLKEQILGYHLPEALLSQQEYQTAALIIAAFFFLSSVLSPVISLRQTAFHVRPQAESGLYVILYAETAALFILKNMSGNSG